MTLAQSQVTVTCHWGVAPSSEGQTELGTGMGGPRGKQPH